MKLLAISEHYFPRVGGTVNYVHETLSALTQLGVEPELLVPGPAPDNWKKDLSGAVPYRVTWVDSDYPAKGDPTREARYSFCRQVNQSVIARLKSNRPDIVHVLFGLFVMEILETEKLKLEGVSSFATVHNVPPMECRQIPPESALHLRLKETIRLSLVGAKNRARLKRHTYDHLIVPSQQVKMELQKSLKQTKISVIDHGPTTELQHQMRARGSRTPVGPVRILTVGGFAPHKRQHIIPETAKRVAEAGVDFVWEVVGPAGRVRDYFDNINQTIERSGLSDCLILREAVPFSKLGELYDRANLYVQPSVEEGFCLTALDAAVAGLPVIATTAGALEKISLVSEGKVTISDPEYLSRDIIEFVAQAEWPDAKATAARAQSSFSWNKAAGLLLAKYHGTRN